MHRCYRCAGEYSARLVEDAADAVLLHSSVTFVRVEADEVPVFAVGNYASPHEAGDGAHATAQVRSEFTFGLPVLGGVLILDRCGIHKQKVWQRFALRDLFQSGRKVSNVGLKNDYKMVTAKSR